MKRMLYITAFPPNHKSGGQTFSYNALVDLKKYYLIDLIYFQYVNHEYEKIDGVNLLRAEDPSMFGCVQIPLLYPVFTRRFSYKLRDYLKSIASNYDILYFDFIQVAVYSLFIKHPNKVIRCHDILAQKYKREESKLYSWVRFSELKILDSAHRIFTPSIKDSEIVKEIYNLSSIYTNEYITKLKIEENVVVNEKFILFGLWSRYENINGLIWFIDNIVKPSNHNFENRIVVMGGGLSEDINAKYLRPYNIKYLGYVVKSHEEIMQYKAMLAPLFDGAGIKVKVLDSFSVGTPVIGTDVAFEGIKDLEGLTYRANTAEEFIRLMTEIPKIDIQVKKRLQNDFIEYYDNNHISDKLKEG